MNDNFGKLYIVSTPIGNLSDMTFRAIDTLKNVDLIAAEDTRRTRELLNHFEIKKELTSYYEHNKLEKTKELIDRIKLGESIALVSDAGTPIISDPGDELLRSVIEEGIEVIAIPGACAAINAIVLSGLDAKSFVFVGFLSDDTKKRKKQILKLKKETRTMIFYVSPHDIKKELKLFIEEFGEDRQVSISREMTKIHEETVRGTLKEIESYFNDKNIRGEFVLVLSGISEEELEKDINGKWEQVDIEEHFKFYLDKGLSEMDAIKNIAKDRNINKRDVYKMLKVGG